MSRKDVFEALSASGVPVAHMAWPKESAPPLPWAVFYLGERDRMCADDGPWADMDRYVAELYQRSADQEVEGRFEAAIEAAFGHFDKQEQWVNQEDCLMTVYRFRMTERADANG